MRIWLTIVASFVLPLTVRAEAGPKVALLPTVSVAAGELRLSDFLPPGAPGSLRAQAAQVMLGQTPRPGTVRVMDIVELEHQLRPELLRRLSFPPSMTVSRAGSPLDSTRVTAVLQAALDRRGVKTKIGIVDSTAAPLLESAEPRLRVLDIRYDGLRRRWNARIAVDSQPEMLPFLVTAAEAETLAPEHAAAQLTSRLQPSAPPPPLLKNGQRAVLVLSNGGYHATIPVVCLESGVSGQQIRVRDESNGMIHHAWISDGGTVQLSGERNEVQ
jgi:hypothetical protein